MATSFLPEFSTALITAPFVELRDLDNDNELLRIVTTITFLVWTTGDRTRRRTNKRR